MKILMSFFSIFLMFLSQEGYCYFWSQIYPHKETFKYAEGVLGECIKEQLIDQEDFKNKEIQVSVETNYKKKVRKNQTSTYFHKVDLKLKVDSSTYHLSQYNWIDVSYLLKKTGSNSGGMVDYSFNLIGDGSLKMISYIQSQESSYFSFTEDLLVNEFDQRVSFSISTQDIQACLDQKLKRETGSPSSDR